MTTRGDPPAGAGDAARATPAGDQGRAAWRAALAAHKARVRRGAARRKAAGWQPGMGRRPPPPPDGNTAA